VPRCCAAALVAGSIFPMSEPSIRQVALLESDWKFHLGDVENSIANNHISAYMANKAGWAGGAARPDFDDSDWRSVSLPHDWSVEGRFDPQNHVDNGFLPRGITWYRRHFRLEPSDRGRYLALQFDGVATHSTVAVNGHVLHRNFCGYTPFTVDFSDVANFGDELNVVAVSVDANPIEGWWYEGAGIYRDVRLIKTSPLHIDTFGVFVCPRRIAGDRWATNIETTLVNASDAEANCKVTWTIEGLNEQMIARHSQEARLAPRASHTLTAEIEIKDPQLWSLETPHLYVLKTLVTADGRDADDDATHFGYRTIRFDPDHGFFLNDRPVKLKGTCNHQDHAGVGVAVPDSIQEFRIRRLLEMGTNAYRSAHNPPSTSLLDACDRLGMLVIDENRNFGSSPEHLSQLQTMVRRDRNHPSVILWSICNEEAIQGTPVGANVARTMQQNIRQLDSSRPLTAAVSGGILNDNAIGSVIEVMGINYQLPLHDQYHAKYPRIPLLASETHCVLSTRGTYETSADQHTFASYDSEVATWGATASKTWEHVLARPFVAGAFIWTGFDYRGEPTPLEWPCVNSHFGVMDTCGFAKDAFFFHKALFASENFLHLFPPWNWHGREGQPIRVVAYTNRRDAELFLNGQSLGKRKVDPMRTATWTVPYQPGTLSVIASDSEGHEPLTRTVKTTGSPAKLGLEIHPTFNAATIPATGRFAIPVTVYAADADGNRVPTAANFVTFALNGPAKILGVGNGDPTCHEPDKASSRSLFRGLAQVILQTSTTPGEIELTATADGLSPALLRFKSTAADTIAFVPSATVRYFVSNWRMSPISTARPDIRQPAMEQDVNSLDRINPGAGPQEAWTRASGYAIYRATGKPPKILQETAGRVLFHEIIGEAEAFIDGAAAGRKSNSSPGELTISFPPRTERFVLSLILRATGSPAGITKNVEIIQVR
jgi:beta-galactosidase